MVFVSAVLSFAKRWRPMRKHLRSGFFDTLRFEVFGGTGGNGLPKYGGIGGQGGCVYCIGKEGATLQSLSKKYPGRRVVAQHGEDSVKKKIIGEPGADEVIEVPLGISILTPEKKLGEINEDGATCIIARGGPGGNKNNNYLGHEGQNYVVTFDLKLIADVGFVGFPNAGKSTLLKALSRAKPKIANYPFTTIRPNLGTMEYEDFRKISLADLPGLIEGAHINIGMGHKFLKHVERTKLLLLITDIQGFALSPLHKFRTCFDTIMLLNKELELYNPELLNKPALLVINKMDTENADQLFEEVKDKLKNINEISSSIPQAIRPEKFLQFDEVMAISAAKNLNDVKILKQTIRDVLDNHEEQESHEEIIKEIGEKIREQGPVLT